jgi:hypothetical protein
MFTRKITLPVTILLIVTLNTLAWGTTYYVKTNGSDNNNGSSWATAFATIQKGITQANDGTPTSYAVVDVNSGNYQTAPIIIDNNNIELSFRIDVNVVAQKTVDPNGDPIGKSNDPNSFRYPYACLFKAVGKSNIVFHGNDTVLGELEPDDWYYVICGDEHTIQLAEDFNDVATENEIGLETKPQETEGHRLHGGEWRHVIFLNNCENVTIKGITLKNSGGDGIFIRGTGGAEERYCKNIEVNDVNCDNNYRNGISVLSVDGLTIDNCMLRRTKGTWPQAGIDFEPEWPQERLQNIVVRNTTIANNRSQGICLSLKKLASGSFCDIGIVFEDIYITDFEEDESTAYAAIAVGRNGDESVPGGSVEFKRVTVENIEHGLHITKLKHSYTLVFEDCSWQNVEDESAIILQLPGGFPSAPLGGVSFVGCEVIDDENRPAVKFTGDSNDTLYEIHGDIYVDNPNRPDANLYDWSGATLSNVDVTLHSEHANTCKAHNDTNDCLYQTPHECYTSINAAIDEAVTSDQITAYPGTHYETVDFDGKAITLRSGDPNDPEVVAGTIIDANGSGTVVTFQSGEDGNSLLKGFTITGGDAGAGYGGGIYCDGSSPTIANCVITGNSARYGGGMENDDSSPKVTDCVFADNEAEWYGGGMDNYDGSSPTVINCVFYGNIADDWGEGGGMQNEDSSPTVTNCTFYANSADYGGAMCNYGASSTAAITNCIFWGDTATYDGDEIYNYGSAAPTVTYSCVQGGYTGSGNISDDPNFTDANDPDGTDNVWATCDDGLALTSTPCIDAANGNVDPGHDIMGRNPMDDPNWSNIGIGDPNYVDMGAYEHDPNS